MFDILKVLCLTSYFLSLISCSNPIGDHHPEWKKYFDEYHVDGCIEIYDLQHTKFLDYNPDRCGQRFIPASTFNICNSLIALETKIIPDTSYVIKWDSVVRDVPSWNHDQSMNEAFRNSCRPCFQQIAKKVGNEKYLQYLKLLHYGNMLTGSLVDSFWLNGDLRISCDEQIEFLKDMYTYQFPISKRTIDLVKGMMAIEKNYGFTLSGATGWEIMKDDATEGLNDTSTTVKNVGWFVGYFERLDDVFIFSSNIQSEQRATENFGNAAKIITENCLKDISKRK